MGRQELHSDSVKIDQKSPIVDHEEYDGDVIIADKPLNKDYLDELAFQEEPVEIILNPSTEKNAPTAFPVWVNGMRAKLDMVTTQHEDANVERPHNRINRATSAVHSYSILEDKNPKGRAWAQEMIRRNF